MHKVQNTDRSTVAYLTFILGIGAIYLTRVSMDSKFIISEDVALLANAIIEKENRDDLEKLINAAGYNYDPKQDIFYSTIYPWQRRFGYCKLFDDASAVLSMIIDCEPIYFEYDNKRWLVGLWKGQYGMTTGGEIGVYYTVKPDVHLPGIYNGPFYRSITDKELLDMSYTLYKNDEKLFTRQGRHWWLAGFRLAEFSEPDELKLEICIVLKDAAMREAFLSGLRKAGYSNDEFKVAENAVSFTFNTPKTPQPFTRNEKTDWIIQRKNQLLCIIFNYLTKPYDNSMDKLVAIQEQFPEMYKLLTLLAGSK